MGKLDNTPMNQEVIQDFLNVPGIVGVALIDGTASPYFHGFNIGFDFSQQHAIAKSIQQVLETTPEGFNSFEFQFRLYRVYLHKLNQGITLLVLAGSNLSRLTYTQAVRRLLIELQIGQNDNPIAEFRALAAGASSVASVASVAQPQPSDPTNAAAPQPELPQREPPQRELEATTRTAETTEPPETTKLPKRAAEEFPDEFQANHLPSAGLSSASIQSASLKDVLAAMNALSQLTTQYLGTLVVANYWKATRPAVDWLNHFQIERSGQMTFAVQAPSERLPLLTHEQHRQIQAWVAAFIERCSKVIRDFAKIVRQTLDPKQSALLFEPPR
jgi:hypothetical protein